MSDLGKLYVALALMACGLLLFVGMMAFGTTAMQEVLMPWKAEIRNTTFKRGPAHIEGTIHDLQEFQMRYYQTNSASVRRALEGRVIRNYNELHPDDKREVPHHVRVFVDSLLDARSVR